MDRRVRAFLAAVEDGSYSSAARRLYITQPAITQQIRSLEQELGVTLFERDGNRMVPTTAGKTAYDFLIKREALDRQMRQALSPWSARRSFVFGCPAGMIAFDNDIYSDVMRLAAQAFPNADVSSVEIPAPPGNYHLLADGQADVMMSEIDSLLATHPDDACARAVRDIEYFVICRRDSHLARKGRLTLQDLSGEVILVFDDVAYKPAVLERLRTVPDPAPALRKQQTLLSSLPLVEMGRGVVIFSQQIPLREDLTMVPLDTGERAKVGLVWLRKNESRALCRFVSSVAECYRVHDQVKAKGQQL
jgi:DNA-binding transcriptional LysR family regulator